MKAGFKHEELQPRSQGLSSKGRKTLVQAGHVPPKKWEMTKKVREGEVSKLRFCLSLTHYMEREYLSKNATHLSCVTASTTSGDVEDTEKDV